MPSLRSWRQFLKKGPRGRGVWCPEAELPCGRPRSVPRAQSPRSQDRCHGASSRSLHRDHTPRRTRGSPRGAQNSWEKHPSLPHAPPRKWGFAQQDPLPKRWSQRALGVTAEMTREGARTSMCTVGSSHLPLGGIPQPPAAAHPGGHAGAMEPRQAAPRAQRGLGRI